MRFIQFIKSHIVYVLTGLITLGVISIIVLLWSNSQTVPPVNNDIPAENIVVDKSLTDEQRTALLAGLDYLYTFGNYTAEENGIESLNGKVTSNFRPKVDELLKELSQDNSTKFSNLIPEPDSYSAQITIQGGKKTAVVTIDATLTDPTVTNQPVEVEQVLIWENNFWFLDDFTITQ